MEPNKITISIRDLERLLNRQKELTIDCLMWSTTGWNGKDLPAGHVESVEINKEKFKDQGMKSSFPEEFNTLKRYLL